MNAESSNDESSNDTSSKTPVVATTEVRCRCTQPGVATARSRFAGRSADFAVWFAPRCDSHLAGPIEVRLGLPIGCVIDDDERLTGSIGQPLAGWRLRQRSDLLVTLQPHLRVTHRKRRRASMDLDSRFPCSAGFSWISMDARGRTGGRRGIRTHGGPEDLNSFRDCPIRPLWQPSVVKVSV
jgi:hypothetical protein